MLVQEADLGELKDHELRTVTKRVPTADEMSTLRFAWKVSKHVKSNAIVFAKDGATLGVGAGQMSRVDSVKIAGDECSNPCKAARSRPTLSFRFPTASRKPPKPAPLR